MYDLVRGDDNHIIALYNKLEKITKEDLTSFEKVVKTLIADAEAEELIVDDKGSTILTTRACVENGLDHNTRCTIHKFEDLEYLINVPIR